ncbi:ADR392Wp [Eremothecium gossypii ATCC 10895]|uniref:ADR392Wp n=1 Tax=Eremothecium gossypii (strain ATCC 10895 / CBS 109.51 / FGSC 9923 / NRRL Y-1056) TaxID=284811 RepID=Q758Y5_EREGS|nr:ADR392Wp [Eremothecium gossypii ATCC 10895]AAS52312.1 ADR392Wp [Eremothecium gossypii ATCC 10895]
MDLAQQLHQLHQVRELAMTNEPDKVLPKVLETALSLYKQNAARPRELSRFCAGLYLDVAAHDRIPASEKPFVAAQHLHDMVGMCQGLWVDHVTYRDVLLGVGSYYEGLFDLVAKTSNETLWKDLMLLKEQILHQWRTCFPLEAGDPLQDHARSLGVKMAAAKLLARMVVVHSRGSGVSISTIPDNHPVIKNKAALQSESRKLLDVLITYLIDEPLMVAPLFSAVLNCLAFIMKRRPVATARILGGLLRFNIDNKYQQENESALRYRLAKRCVERCYKNFVNFGMKAQLIRNSGDLAPYHHKLGKIAQTLHMIAEETKSKGILNFDPALTEKKMSPAEREKYLAACNNRISKSPTPADPPISVPAPVPAGLTAGAQLGMVTPQPPLAVPPIQNSTPVAESSDLPVLIKLQNYTMSKSSVSNFFNNSPVAFDNNYASIYSLMNSKNSEIDLSGLSQETLVKLCTEAIYRADTNKVIAGLSIVAQRYTDLMDKAMKHSTGDADDSDRKKKKPKLEESRAITADTEDGSTNVEDEEESKEFTLGPPAPMSRDEKLQHLQLIVSNICDVSASEDAAALTAPLDQLPVLNRARLLQWDNRTSWVVLLTRLSSRGLQADESMSNLVRQHIYNYFLQDFSNRVAVVIEWLSEEWFSESVRSDAHPVYNEWSLRVLDGLVPFLDNSHRKMFIRLVSELPHLNRDHISRFTSLCLDPLRAPLGFQALKFLIMFRPPVKPLVRDVLEEMKTRDESVREQCDSIIAKFY